MIQDDFQKRAKQWLTIYKREFLHVSEDGIWLRNGRPYGHILPQEKYRLNILAGFRDEFWKWFSTQRIQLQRDFHHLNSSQALSFNLFFPLMIEEGQGLAALLKAMNVTGSVDGTAAFEFQPDPSEGTCLDFSLTLKPGTHVNFEIKYTESEFGSARADRSHLDKFEAVYKGKLSGRFDESFCCASRFLKHYQIGRNVWHLNKEAGDMAVFLFPRANARLLQDEKVIRSCAVEPFRSRIRVLYLEDLITALEPELRGMGGGGQQYLSELRLKYLPQEVVTGTAT